MNEDFTHIEPPKSSKEVIGKAPLDVIPFEEKGFFVSAEVQANKDRVKRHSHEVENVMQLASGIEGGLESLLDEGADDDRILKERKVLSQSRVIIRGLVNVSSNNNVEQIYLDDEKEPKIAYAKSEMGESFYVFEDDGRVMRQRRVINEDGEIEVIKNEVMNRQVAAALKIRREKEAMRRAETASYYNISMDEVPVDDTEMGVKYMDQGHAVKSEYFSSVLDTMLRFKVSQPTAIRKEEGALVSVQAHAQGKALGSKELENFLDNKSNIDGAESLMRIACLDFLIKQADRNHDNIFYDDVTKSFRGIDNGGANQLSRAGELVMPNGEIYKMGMPVDYYNSIPMDMVGMDSDWQLDKKAYESLRNLYENILNYVKFIYGQLSEEEAGQLSEHVKQGVEARMISDMYRMMHERMDENGNVIPETRVIAQKEADEFMKRLMLLLVNKRPPTLGVKYYDKKPLDIYKKILERRGK